MAQDIRAGVDQDGETAGAEPESVEAVGSVRAPEVLSSVRAAERQWRQARGVRRAWRLLESDRSGRLRIVRQRRLRVVRGVRVARVVRMTRIGITVGDPAGIGPEIARKAAEDARVRRICEPVLYGPHTKEELAAFTPGRLSAEAGRAAYDAIV